MIRPNWNIFKAKFSENPQDNFEWFCYLLFCKEFDRPLGVFRYKNQSAIETDPISIEDQVIGWQAKFYDSTLSSHKDEIISSITKAKQDYPDITKILFYTNQEWAQFRGRKPKGLKEIEATAKELGITLDWRTASFFDSEFVSKDNAVFAQYFFSLDRSVFEVIEEQKKHTQNILHDIQTCMNFRTSKFEIDRNDLLETIKDMSHKVIIINGVGGSGKTVLVKKLFEEVKDVIPFYVFKATEFELRNINDLFTDFNFYKFSEIHSEENEKIIVIDSAEKLLDLKNTEPFKEFLTGIIATKWKIIFTTRDNYLEDLNFQFLEIFKIIPVNVTVQELEVEELDAISQEHSFSLPGDNKLLELLRNPFYLNEYLKNYNEKEELQYQQFKNKLWNQNIKKAQPEREKCFLKLAFQRANEGQFYINPNCDSAILDEFVKEGILGYESSGYFITRDIYEEWGLEKIIEREFLIRSENNEFFQKIGLSLPVRRSFRNWLSEKLLLDDEQIKLFIEETIEADQHESFWKDEILVSVLLSNYSRSFFDLFTIELLATDLELLKRLSFLLRLACKEVDDTLSRFLNDDRNDLLSLKYVYTKPKGQGWKEIIRFVFENIEDIEQNNLNFILPILQDWNSSNKEGKTTRYSSLIALNCYQWFIDEQGYSLRDDTKKQIIQTVLYGAAEIQNELKAIIDKIVQNNWKYHLDPYYDLSITILTELEGLSVSAILPTHILKIAELFWTYSPREYPFHRSGIRINIEEHFGLETRHIEYFPASSYQTPIYWLLQYSFKDTLDFILRFTNIAINAYANSDFDKSVRKVQLEFEDEEREQFISHCLWNMYRGTSSPISPHLLQSIHMALEKFFLEFGEEFKAETLESWLIYLLRNSESASISAVVTSIVLAFPDKTFNVAKVLFKTKEFILFDTGRYASDLMSKSLCSFMTGLHFKNKLYEDERLNACDDKHRKQALEHLFLHYQLFRNEGVSEESANERQIILWGILDSYYQEFPKEDEQSDSDKRWGLFLARMDRRKMSISTEEANDGILIQFNPELEPGLKTYSENSIAAGSKFLTHITLKIWAESKFRRDEKYKDYDQYESDPKSAFSEAREIIEKINSITQSEVEEVRAESVDFVMFNISIPTYVFSVLLRDHEDELCAEEIEYCKDVIIQAALATLNPNYEYQILDGVDAAISILPRILEMFPEEKDSIKTILLSTLFLEFPVGGFYSNTRFNIFPINAIRMLWKEYLNDAKSLLFGYLFLAPRFEEYVKRIREENKSKGNIGYGGHKILPDFFDENQALINNVLENEVILNDIGQIEEIELITLKTAFQIIPSRLEDKDIENIAMEIISTIAQKLLVDRREKGIRQSRNEIDFEGKHDFLEAYANFILGLEIIDIWSFLEPFIDQFSASEIYADLFQEFIFSVVRLRTYDSFWVVWDYFKDKVIGLSKEGNRYGHTDKIIKNYLFAHPYWNDDLKEWQALKDKNKRFFTEISKKIGFSPSSLYAIAILLDGIGSHFIDDGILWISYILTNHEDLVEVELERNTIYHLENVIRKYMFRNRDKAKKNKTLKDSIVVILNFLVERGSVVGYMVRESIL